MQSAVRLRTIRRYIPFLHLAESRIYTICILSGINFGKEAFNGGREQQPVSVRRVNASETFELFYVAFLCCLVQRFPQLSNARRKLSAI